MFKRFAVLQWTWFFVLVIAVDVILSRSNSWNMFSTNYGNEISKIYWAGLVVVFWTWVVRLIIKYINKGRQETKRKLDAKNTTL